MKPIVSCGLAVGLALCLPAMAGAATYIFTESPITPFTVETPSGGTSGTGGGGGTGFIAISPGPANPGSPPFSPAPSPMGPSAVPLPASLPLLAAGLLGVGLLRRRRRA